MQRSFRRGNNNDIHCRRLWNDVYDGMACWPEDDNNQRRWRHSFTFAHLQLDSQRKEKRNYFSPPLPVTSHPPRGYSRPLRPFRYLPPSVRTGEDEEQHSRIPENFSRIVSLLTPYSFETGLEACPSGDQKGFGLL
ncbi:hypothetical protein NPIL_335541 [Nephila pilipes]|uniref:Uncharacterized protein n=1 Tax=Nephila pilipes TaxID=299642 RepID=A0A8X6P5F7_NEPPI|nr:hypothetical protein NPIL_335541 [Nephila pilipes]